LQTGQKIKVIPKIKKKKKAEVKWVREPLEEGFKGAGQSSREI